MLAHEASRRGHDVCYITPDDFVLSPDDALRVHAHFVPAATTRTRSLDKFFKDMRGAAKNTKLIDIDDIDVLMLRNDPSNDAIERPWGFLRPKVGVHFTRYQLDNQFNGTIPALNAKGKDVVVIGSGAIVCKNIDTPGTYVGVPARKVS